jgi:hypothetical protein
MPCGRRGTQRPGSPRCPRRRTARRSAVSDFWLAIRWVNVLAMAFLVGGAAPQRTHARLPSSSSRSAVVWLGLSLAHAWPLDAA